jgi:hypothetical protein
MTHVLMLHQPTTVWYLLAVWKVTQVLMLYQPTTVWRLPAVCKVTQVPMLYQPTTMWCLPAVCKVTQVLMYQPTAVWCLPAACKVIHVHVVSNAYCVVSSGSVQSDSSAETRRYERVVRQLINYMLGQE